MWGLAALALRILFATARWFISVVFRVTILRASLMPAARGGRACSPRSLSRGLRYDAELDKRIEAATKKGGFSSPSAFMRAAIERELASHESGVDAAEQRIAASLDRMAREIRNQRTGQQALFAFVDVPAKTFLTCVQNRPRMCTTKPSLSASSATTGFSRALALRWWGDSQAATAELLGRGNEG